MTILFNPNICAPHDPAGWGRWRSGHYGDHRQYITMGATATPRIVIPDYDLHAWSDDTGAVTAWLNAHYQVHQAIRSASGITGIDLSQVDLSDDQSFIEWQDDHNLEHQAINQFFGIT